MDELYLDNIDEFVNDHDKIVTYKWLSLTLGVHVNTAKQMLFHYLDHKRKESSAQLNATYLVSGKFVDNGHASHKVSVVREDQLEDVKSRMSLVVSVHVYSVQKASLKDSGPLYSVDYDAVKDNLASCSKYSAIRCATAVPMSSQQLQQAREIHRAAAPEPEPSKPSLNGEAASASRPAAKPQKGIMGMFASRPAPAKSQDRDVKPEQKEEPAPAVEAPKSKPAAKANPMMNFFGSQAAKKPEKPVKEEEEEEEEAAAAPSSSSSSPAEPQRQTSHPEEKQEVAAEAPKDTKKEPRSKTKRVVDSDSEDEKKEKKKRRRIKKPEPDSSDEDIIPDSPQQMKTREPSPSPEKKLEPVSHPPQATSERKIRRRRQVLKARTFIDDEGCIVTEKAYQSESYSETEDDVQASKPASKNPFPTKASSHKPEEKKSQKKTAANANKSTKQASIMGFFQKK